MKKLVLLIGAVALAACTDNPGALRALEGAGYTQIELGGYAWFQCDGKSDTFSTKFTAKGPAGKIVSGAVCSGLFKGSTIRTD